MMPISSAEKLSAVMMFVVAISPRPKRILDVGMGCGTYGMLCRAYLEMSNSGRYERGDWETQLIGVEVFEPYRNPMWAFAYDEVHVGDAVKLVPTLGSFDLVLLCDILEHLPKEVGKTFLDDVLSRSSYVIVSSPCGHTEQEAIFGNEAERHVSGWSKRDFRGCHVAYRSCGTGFVALLSRGALPKGVTRLGRIWTLIKIRLIRIGPASLYRFYKAVKSRLLAKREAGRN